MDHSGGGASEVVDDQGETSETGDDEEAILEQREGVTDCLRRRHSDASEAVARLRGTRLDGAGSRVVPGGPPPIPGESLQVNYDKS